MKRFKKVYLEISNICNLNCSFCPGTARPKAVMAEPEFAMILQKLRPWTDFLYFHLMGEPLCHPELARFLELAAKQGFKVILTTNGTLLERRQDLLLQGNVHKINISLHAFEANDLAVPFEDYLQGCFRFGQAAQGKLIISYRLWNSGGADTLNTRILETMKAYFPGEWVQEGRGTRIGQRIYLEHGDKFDWPDLCAQDRGSHVFCYGLRDQLGVLCDGTVVPCCLDHNGDIPLGNLLTQDLEEILNTPRAKQIFDGFSRSVAAEALCRKCGYARRFG